MTTIVFSQDYVVTWNNDTISCILPAKPGKEGVKPSFKYENGHIRTLAIFPNDSLRVLEAGQVKGYYRQKHGSYLLCDGHFEAKKMRWPNKDTNWYFMSRVEEGEYASLYMIYLKLSRSPVRYYFLIKKDDPDPLFTTYLRSWKHIQELLNDDDIKEGMQNFFSARGKKQYIKAVKEYNRLKRLSPEVVKN